MATAPPPRASAPQSGLPAEVSALRGRVVSRFNTAFSLMSIIPLLICFYLLTVRFVSVSILEGLNGVYALLAIVFALLGLFAGHQVIGDIIRRLMNANTKLARLYEQQASFVSNVAHEFRSPLAVFKSALDNLADGLHGPITEDQQEPVHMCQKEVNRLKRLVGDLLDLSRIEAGKFPLQQQEVVLQEVLRSVAEFYKGLLKERGLGLSIDLPPEPVRLTGDRDRLQQVFINLVGNAVKFTERGEIRIRLQTEGAAARMEVEDTGPGIAAEDLERIFDKFERVGSGNEEGSGLGLPIARDIVELHHGRIWAESRIGQCSRFIVQLPGAAVLPEARP